MLNQIGDQLHGFTVTRIRESDELHGRLVEMTFDRTGTELVWVDNGLENKVFSIAFKTLPEDSTGVFHILEHSVLCGSAKYPVREPFVELLKSSMNTFLNAMTFPDKTMYPVASRNLRDFLNLTEVYLDAVFAPAILENPNIFYQEGWHIEEDSDGTLSYKGVVFNEMKGVISDVDSLAEYGMMSLLFPDTCYGFNSGGDPAVIPSLSYEQFCETYHRFYHPSNARIYLDGDVPIDETLRLIASYLSGFEKSTQLPEITLQTRKSASATQYYELAADETLTDKSHLTVGRIFCGWQDTVKQLAARILLDAVCGTNESPVKRAVLSAGLAQELDIAVDNSIAQPPLVIHAKNVTDGKADDILPLIRRTATELAENGLDYDALEASANRIEFRLLEPDEPQGIDRCVNCMDSWLYGGDPMQTIVYRDAFAEIRKMLKEKQFEALLKELLVEEDGTVVLYLLPSHTRGNELRQAEADRLAEIRKGWSDADLEANRKLNEALSLWQQTPDSPEQLATLPTLPITEINAVPSWTETVEKQVDGMTVLYHPAPCSGIVHLALNFAMTDYTPQELSLLSNINAFCGKLATANYSALELQQLLKNKLGRFVTSVDVSAKKNVFDVCTPMFSVQCSVLEEKLPEAFDLICEVLQQTDFRQKEKIREILLQVNERLKQNGVAAGHAFGVFSVLSHYSARSAVVNQLSGYPLIHETAELVRNFDARFDAFASLMQKLQTETICRSRLIFASVTAAAEQDISALLRRLPEGTPVPAAVSCQSDMPMRMGYRIPAQIGFAVQGCRLPESEYSYCAGWRMIATLISLGYLWNVVRVQGGAYGTGISVRREGIFTYSYRDPSPARSLEINRGISGFIRQFCESSEPLDKYIISTLSDEDPLRAPRAQGAAADTFWLAGHTKEDVIAERREMLAMTKQTLLDSLKIWDAFAEQGAVCVCASENLLADCGGLTVLEA